MGFLNPYICNHRKMIVVLLSSLIALLFAYWDSIGKLKIGLKVGMILMTVLAAIRYQYGNDYVSYYNDFTFVGKYSIGDILFLQEKMQYVDAAFKDVGAAVLYRLCKPIGFMGFVAALSAFQGWVYFSFIKENVPRNYYWLALFVYLFDFNNYVLQLSMMRQGLVIALLVWSWHFLRKGKYTIPILLVLLSFTIHKSSIIFAPFIFLNTLSYKSGKALSVIVLGAAAFLWLASSTVGSLLENMMDFELLQLYNEAYGMEDGGRMGLTRLLLAYIPYCLAIFYFLHPQTENEQRFLVLLSIFGVLILPFSFFIQMTSRLCFYFNIFLIASIPITLVYVKRPIVKLTVISLFMFLSLYQYFDLFLHSVYTKPYASFDTIFSAL